MADFVVAVTGGIASGKSAVTRRFEALGVHVADADVSARALVEPGQPALEAIVARFGVEILLADGRLDRAALRARVFEDTGARRELEALLHPRIRAALEAECRAAPGPYAVVAIPLLAEGGRAAYPWVDRVLVVDVPREVQLDRLMRRDGIDDALAARMLDAQAGREVRRALADDLVDNSGDLPALHAQVDALHARYRALGAARS
ncbi:dephospho-CoA kinase [Coralloluteibacterium thermophilus]|uniref:Dephospho-CoA kinase n=1 Tax=Coralloluteibacterium thermophilum TaxID=2707049 RepID=A0ABV9NQB6_9GAMM